MCYLVREKQAGAAQSGGATVPPSPDRWRPRLIGGVGAALLAGLAVAAIVVPPSASSVPNVKDSGAPAPLAARTATVPATPVVEQTSVPMDDGVPSSLETAKAGLGHCDHDL